MRSFACNFLASPGLLSIKWLIIITTASVCQELFATGSNEKNATSANLVWPLTSCIFRSISGDLIISLRSEKRYSEVDPIVKTKNRDFEGEKAGSRVRE